MTLLEALHCVAARRVPLADLAGTDGYAREVHAAMIVAACLVGDLEAVGQLGGMYEILGYWPVPVAAAMPSCGARN